MGIYPWHFKMLTSHFEVFILIIKGLVKPDDLKRKLALYITKIYNFSMNEMIFKECIGFDWDQANQSKNKQKHNVSPWECEQVFFNEPLLVYEDKGHSQMEKRLYVLGKTDANRKLFIAFTIRKQLIRVISARDMSKKERVIYEEA